MGEAGDQSETDGAPEGASAVGVEERITFLRTVPVFGGLEDHELRRLADYAQPAHFPAGTPIVEEADLAKEMFVVLAGRVEVLKQAGGQQTPLTVLGPGECFGEMSLIDIQPRSATVRAAEDAQVLVLSFDDLIRVYKTDMNTYTLIVLNIAREISRRLRQANRLIADLGHDGILQP